MSEQLRDISIRVEIDTNKQTYRVTTDNMKSLIEWWNAHSDLGLAEYELIEDRARSGGNEGSDTPDAIQSAIDVLERAKHDAIAAEDWQQAADLRSGQFRLERLLATPDCTSRNPSPPGT